MAVDKRTKLDQFIASYTSSLALSKRTLTSEEEERLCSLGYISQAAGTPKGNLPDPKEMLSEMQLLQRAESCELEGDYAEGAKIYEELLSRQPGNQAAYINLALMKARMNQFEEAVSILQEAVDKFPGSVVLLSRLAHTHMVMGRLKKALEAWRAVLEIEPQYFDGLLSSAWILDLRGNDEEARSFYIIKALEVEPENRFLRINYALNLGKRGRIKEAIEIFEKLKAEYPDDYEILLDLGIAYGYADDLNRAIENLKKSTEIKPSPAGYLNLAVAYRQAGHITEAIECLRRYLANPEGESPEKIARVRQELTYLETLKSR